MKGILLFAFNTDTVDYYSMAIATAKRANYFLNLPVSVVTDSSVNPNEYDYKFDNLFVVEPDRTNVKGKSIWINKGRYQAYDLTPYEDTIVLDTDYLINSNKLIEVFELNQDFICHNSTHFLFHPENHQEQISPTAYNTLWATIIGFKKTNATKQLFNCIKMVQENYSHYAYLYNMHTSMFRNDYALTIAHRIINGQHEDKSNYIPWRLVHAGSDITISKVTESEFNTEYIMFRKNSKDKNEYIMVNDTDFHCMNKTTFMEIV
jgi:hypothetical protein